MHIKDFQTSLAESVSYLNVVANNIGEVTIKIFNKEGFIAKTVNAQIEKGAQLLDINMSDLNNGTYVLNAFWGDKFLKSFKFTKE